MSLLNSARWATVRASIGHDLTASIVVLLVALPLCLGIAIASGAPPVAGLISGVIGGIVVGSLTGSPLQVSGPAAGLAVVMFELASRHGWERLGAVIVVAGLVQLVAALLRLGQWFRAVSPAVIQGMLAGIGVLILGSQFHVAVDDDSKGDGLTNLLMIPAAIWKGLMPLDGSSHHWAARIGLLTILIIMAWKLMAPKKLKFLPAPLMAVSVATLVAAALGLDIRYVEVASLWSELEAPQWSLSAFTESWVLLSGLSVALIASAETLICATGVDSLHSNPGARTRYDRELAAQGIGNMLCGALGGLAITGVIVRSAANIEAGAKTRLSTVLHGVWLLILVSCCRGLLSWIPTASLAAVLVYTGYKLMNVKAARSLLAYGKSELAIYVVTIVVIVSRDLLTGVIVGSVLSALKLLYNFSRLDIRVVQRGDQVRLRLAGAATFLRLPKLAAALERVPPNSTLHVDLENLTYVDHACLDLLMNWEKQHEATGGRLVMDWGLLTARFHRVGGAAIRGEVRPPREKVSP